LTNINKLISIIIPTYNSENSIEELLKSVSASDLTEENEIIVVDDGSIDMTVELAKRYPVRVIRNDKNQGSAKARNQGVAQAKGEKIIFFDSDVVIKHDTLSKLIESFQAVAEKGALIGIYSKEPLNKGFIPEYKALLDYSHWQKAQREISFFEPRCAIIRKETFNEIGGFDESIKGANVEDYEFGYRLLKKYKIYVDKTIQVEHRFPEKIGAIIRNFFQRGYSWVQLFLERKKFDNIATTQSAALSCISAFLSLIFLMSFFLSKVFILAGVLLFAAYIYLYKSFFILVCREKGFHFTLKAVALQYVLSIVLSSAGIYALARRSFKPKQYAFKS
jgi:glycosyltransferase involved in cell wall biosynthesis